MTDAASGEQTQPSQIEPISEKRFRVVATVAAVLFAPQVLAHLVVPFTVIPTFKEMFSTMGGALPQPTLAIITLGPWVGLLLFLVDIAIFWLCYRLASKYWIGLLFAPLFAGGIVLAPLIYVLYMPMFQIITLVK